MYCISSASERNHEIACTSWSSCLWKLCELVSNIEEQLCIVLYMKPIDHLHDLAIWKWLKNVYISFDLKCICVWCLDNWSRILSGKPFNTFSMARLKTLQFHLTPTPLFTATHTLFFLSFTIFSSCTVIGVFGLFSCDPRFMANILILIHRDLWNSQKWQIIISVNRDLDYLLLTEICDQKHPPL